jgi:hypothetical protein
MSAASNAASGADPALAAARAQRTAAIRSALDDCLLSDIIGLIVGFDKRPGQRFRTEAGWRSPQSEVSADGLTFSCSSSKELGMLNALGRDPIGESARTWTLRFHSANGVGAGLVDPECASLRPIGELKSAYQTGRVVVLILPTHRLCIINALVGDPPTASFSGTFNRPDAKDPNSTETVVQLTANVAARTLSASFNGVPLDKPLLTDVRNLERMYMYVMLSVAASNGPVTLSSADE